VEPYFGKTLDGPVPHHVPQEVVVSAAFAAYSITGGVTQT
jgi:hypothetical protein